MTLQRLDGIAQNLRRLFIPHAQAARDDNRKIYLHIGAELVDGALEAQQLNGAGFVLHRHISHDGIIFRGAGFAGGDDPGYADGLTVGKAGRALLLLKIRQNLLNGHGTGGFGQLPIVTHGVAGEEKTRGLLFHGHQLHGGKLRNVRQVDMLELLGHRRAHAEHIYLPLQVLPVGKGHAVHHRLENLDELGALGTQGIKGTAADQVLHGPLIHVRRVIHTLAEILEGCKGAVLVTALNKRLDKAAANILDGHQAEANVLPLYREAVIGVVDVRG